MQRPSPSAVWILLSVIASLSVVACDQRSAETQRVGDRGMEERSAGTPSEPSTQDRTAMDQSESSDSIRITAEIRRGILGADNMSVAAQNCTIVTDPAGVVTLRGPVGSQVEKDAIGAIARSAVGVSSVNNLLQVTPD